MKQLAKVLAPHYLRFRQQATRFSFRLMYLWAGMMLLGLGTVYYRGSRGEKFKCMAGRLGRVLNLVGCGAELLEAVLPCL